MNMKLTVAVVALLAVPAFALAQKAPPAPKGGAKPTAADAQKILGAIGADPAKTKIYCDASKIFKQIDALDQKKDKKKIDDLYKQGDALEAQLGPDYVKLTTGMQSLDQNSKDGKDIGAAFSTLDQKCGA